MTSFTASTIYKKVTLQILLLLCIYQCGRFLFFCINHSYFKAVDFERYVSLMKYGLRFDLSAVFLINYLYLVLMLVPFQVVNSVWYKRLLNGLFIGTNSIAFLFDLADIGYYPYVRKRMTAEVFHLLGKKSDFIDLLPSYLKEFWFVPIAAVCFVAVFVLINRRIKALVSDKVQTGFSFQKAGMYVFTLFFSIILIRGGMQLKPIMNVSALLIASNDQTPLVLNTPFSILHSLGDNKLDHLTYYSENELLSYCHPVKNYSSGGSFKKSNVVVIILESFGRQYTGIGGRKSYTPFLDSLMDNSLVFTNAYANAHRSADGIPAVLAGIPVFMEDSYMNSPYSNNTIDALPLLLKRNGYHTSFFHGGTNGTMNFDIFSTSVGFERYMGRTQYHNDKEYDGAWGIWDEPFLQYYANELGKEKQPFMSSVFTLSSHEPFRLPQEYKNSAFSTLNSIYRGISYSDMALKKFFITASKQPWYSNTLFVITADHNYLANNDSVDFYNRGMGLYAIPIILFHPSDSKLRNYSKQPMQQIDIMPTVLDYLHYPSSFFAYGNSAFDSTVSHVAYTQMGEHQQMLQDNRVLVTDNQKTFKLYDYQHDSLLNHPISNDSLLQESMSGFRMFKQLLQNTLIDNKQTVKAFKGQ